MNAPDWIMQAEECVNALARGTDRQALPVGDGSTASQLAVLAGLAAFRRMQVPESPESFEQSISVANEGQLVSDAVRASIARYFKANRDQTPDAAVRRVFGVFQSANVAVHPFDYAELEYLLRVDPALFNVQFKRWASEKTRSDSVSGDMSPDNWTEFTPAERRDYIRQLHVADPDTARALLSDALPGETASVRGKLLQAIESSVTVADQVFLEGLLSDRAKSVSALATNMLAYLPATEQNQERFEEAASRLSLKTVKVSKKTKLVVEQPKGYRANSHQLIEWYRSTFGGVDPIALAAKLELKPKKFLELIEQPYLACECVLQLARQNEFDLMKPLAVRIQGYLLQWMCYYIENDLNVLQADVKATIWEVAAQVPDELAVHSWVQMLEQLYLRLNAPMPKATCIKLLKNKKVLKLFKASIEDDEKIDRQMFERLAAVLETDAYTELQKIINDAPPSMTTYAHQLISLIALIDEQYPIVTNSET